MFRDVGSHPAVVMVVNFPRMSAELSALVLDEFDLEVFRNFNVPRCIPLPLRIILRSNWSVELALEGD